MSMTSVEHGVRALRNGQLLVVVDDFKAQMGALIGLAEMVSPQNVNLMTKIGKGLVYACIPQEKANEMKLPFMVEADQKKQMKRFTISVDYITTTTGISAYERADTIKALADDNVRLEHFRTPGHVFPVVSNEKGLLGRIDIVEAAVDLARITSTTPVAYMCEILNTSGEIASKEEIFKLSEDYGIAIVRISDILDYKKGELLFSFSGFVISGNEFGRKIGFPTANLEVSLTDVPLGNGVYAVRTCMDNSTYYGVMNVAGRSTLDKEDATICYEVHLFDFDRTIYGQTMKVDVLFYVREEISFTRLDHLMIQLSKDVAYVKKRCRLQKMIS